MKLPHLDPDAALASLGSGRDGLNMTEAGRRLAEYGPNVLETVARERLWWRFARELGHFFALVLWVAAALAFFAEWPSPGRAWPCWATPSSR